jgi:hypothetical protein
MNPSFPIYIVSKGRAFKQLTFRELTKMGVRVKVVVEPIDFEDYSKTIGQENLLCLPFNDLGEGSTPARNWIWNHSIQDGHSHHWILDDNIEGFHRLNRNTKFKVTSGTIFKCAEDFVLRYENVKLAGFNYHSFCKTTDKIPAYYLNTRIYSCILIDNTIPFRWRGKYNEDTDLSLRVLKSNECTVLFNAFLCGKVTTMRMKGGNTENVYNDGTNRRAFADSLAEQHPDVASVVWRFNRWHHHVDYSKFKKNKLIKKHTFNIQQYPMTLK